MKHIPNIAGGLLGIAFVIFGINFFAPFLPPFPAPEPGSPPALFWGAVGASGFMALVKALEIIGGVLVALPKTRNIGLLILGPIVINILAYNIFIAGGSAVFQPPVIVVSVLSAYLLWAGRKQFACLVR
ncbi:MAG: DoxX family protein [Verrucomicrobiae bacterium]|nr:DoxX family protein [Verrucomicrobiae bacterium]NNJ86640.1 DoxX family protein [Akkermansiaceae bacterium]